MPDSHTAARYEPPVNGGAARWIVVSRTSQGRLINTGHTTAAAAEREANRVRVFGGSAIVGHYRAAERELPLLAVGDIVRVRHGYSDTRYRVDEVTADRRRKPYVLRPVSGEGWAFYSHGDLEVVA